MSKQLAGLEASVVKMTPALAQSYLTKNLKNRPIRRSYVNELVAAMKRGEWKLNGETIKVSKSDVLLDGQHRLMAVYESQTTQNMIVVAGLDDDAFTTIDINRRRTSADALAIAGVPNQGVIAAAIRLVLLVSEAEQDPERTINSRTTYTHVQIMEWCDAYYEELQPWLPIGRQVDRANLLEQSMVVGLGYLFGERNKSDAKLFFARLADGMGLKENDAIFVLRELLAKNATSAAKLPRMYVAAMVMQAWNQWRQRKATSAEDLIRIGNQWPKLA